ncbi:MAG: alpha/beta fold hydrolase [Actinomycetes bacterium]
MPTRPGVRPGAEAWSADGGPTGVLLCHGFTGSPASMRPWGEQLAAAGLTVQIPRLPGHGTTWQELNLTRWDDWYGAVEAALVDLSERCPTVFVMGLSVGGTLTLRLAELQAQRIRGICVVNPMVHTENKAMVALPLLRHVVPSLPGVVNDIKKPGQDELGYDRLPLQALYSLSQTWPAVRDGLPSITMPVLVMHSTVDHVVEPSNSEYVLAHLGSSDVTDVELADSYHVATLDNDAPQIVARSLEFVERLTTTTDHG